MSALKYILQPIVIILMGFGIAACDKEDSSRSAAQVEYSTMNKASEEVKDKVHKLGMNVDDAAITAKVKAAILAKSGMDVFDISVETNKGVAILTGTIDSDTNRNKAESLVAGVEGVKSVDNRLLVQPGT